MLQLRDPPPRINQQLPMIHTVSRQLDSRGERMTPSCSKGKSIPKESLLSGREPRAYQEQLLKTSRGSCRGPIRDFKETGALILFPWIRIKSTIQLRKMASQSLTPGSQLTIWVQPPLLRTTNTKRSPFVFSELNSMEGRMSNCWRCSSAKSLKKSWRNSPSNSMWVKTQSTASWAESTSKSSCDQTKVFEIQTNYLST